MSNKQYFVPSGPPSGNEFLRHTLIEGPVTGIFRPTFDEIGDNSSSPSAQASLTQSSLRMCARDRPVQISTATTPATLTPAMNGLVFIGTKSSGNQTLTLPPAQTVGLEYTIVCGNAAGEILVNPVGTDTVSIKASEGGANVTTAAGVGIKNTAATNVLNDYVTLVSDGVSQWWMIGESGTWASQ